MEQSTFLAACHREHKSSAVPLVGYQVKSEQISCMLVYLEIQNFIILRAKGYFRPPAEDTPSPWRKITISNPQGSTCFHSSGWLQARKPYLPDDMRDKTGLWCYKNDFICNPIVFRDDSGHKEYRLEGKGVDQAAQEAISRLKLRLEVESPRPNPSDPTPPPTPQYQALDTQHILGEGTAGENVVFAVDEH